MPFPVFVKAVAGGGGRGMRRVEDPAELAGAVQAAMREDESAFGDATGSLSRRPRASPRNDGRGGTRVHARASGS